MNSTHFDSIQYTAKEFCTLMRRHRKTIAQLAEETGLDKCRIQYMRMNGAWGLVAIDMCEAITGQLTPKMQAALRSYSQGGAL